MNEVAGPVWKVSQFTVVHDLAARGADGMVLVLNTATGRSFISSHAAWRRAVDALGAGVDAPAATAATIAKLADQRYLVPAERDENESFLADFDRVRLAPRRINPIIAFTTACNIACTYCYEEGVRPRTMSADVLDATVRWIERRIVDDGVREVAPQLFGGEPFLHPELPLRFMDRLNAIGDRHGASVAYAASSNGMLLSDELATALARRRLVQIQISLDGPECVHDERRVGRRGQPSYRESLRGILNAVRAIPSVTVKVNFDRHNVPHLPDLFDELVALDLAAKVTVKLEAIALQFPDSKVAHPEAVVIAPESTEMADVYQGLTAAAERRGLRVTRDTAHTTPCMYTSQWGVIVGPDGGISKCISMVGRSDHEVGNVLDGDWEPVPYDAAMDVRKKTSDCVAEQCSYLPVCAGGCAYEVAVRGGQIGDRFCTKPNLARYHYLRQLLRHQDRLAGLGVRPLGEDELLPAAPSDASAGGWSPVSFISRRDH
jgi:uncharacterized protein